MADQQRPGEARPEPQQGKIAQGSVAGTPANSPSQPAAGASSADQPTTPVKLTAEEQMALYEKELKEGDWGHQPC